MCSCAYVLYPVNSLQSMFYTIWFVDILLTQAYQARSMEVSIIFDLNDLILCINKAYKHVCLICMYEF